MPNLDRGYERLKGLITGNVCARCSFGHLAVAWVQGAWRVRCGNCGPGPPLAYDPYLVARYQRGDILTAVQQQNAERILDRIARRVIVTNKTTALVPEEARKMILMQADDNSTVLQLQAKWPRDLRDPVAAMQLILLAKHYGLSPFMGEIVPYQGTPYIPIKGLVRKASDSGRAHGLSTRAATPQERRDQRADDEDDVWTASFWLDNPANVSTGWGKVTKAERDAQKEGDKGLYYVNPVLRAKPAEMAESRAVHDAMERSGVLHLPSLDPDFLLQMGERLLEARLTQQPDDQPVPQLLGEPPEEDIERAALTLGAPSSTAEHLPHKEAAVGSIPAGPTTSSFAPSSEGPNQEVRDQNSPPSPTAQAFIVQDDGPPPPEMDWLDGCPDHQGVNWLPPAKPGGQYFHATQRGQQDCLRSFVLQQHVKVRRETLGMTGEALMAFIQRHFGKPYVTEPRAENVFTDQDRCRLLALLRVEQEGREADEAIQQQLSL